MPDRLSMAQTLRLHWPEYLIEAWALGTFMVCAGAASTLLAHLGGSPLSVALGDGSQRAATGILMGATAVALIYSPWGKRSGAHMNPAVTLAFLSLRRIAPWDGVFYILAQCTGAVLGVFGLLWAIGAEFALPPVSYVATMPGSAGARIAFAAETCISFALMLAVLITAGRTHLARYTGMIAGVLVALFIVLEAPLSGMSMNPARSLAPAIPSGHWQSLWIYLTAPVLGMWLATRVYLLACTQRVGCAKLFHSARVPCIHCGYTP